MDSKYPQRESARRRRARLRLPSIEAQLLDWLEEHAGATRNVTEWLRWEGFQVYVRQGSRTIDGESVLSLVIASVEIPERLRGRGWWTRFIQLAELAAPAELLVIDEAGPLEPWLERRGSWRRSGSSFHRRLAQPRPSYPIGL